MLPNVAEPQDSKPGDNGGMRMDAETFERLVVSELDALPDEMVEGLENLVFVVEDCPGPEHGVEEGSMELLGLYDGVDLPGRSTYGFGELPDRIILFREPLLQISADEEQLRREVHITLVHEIGHVYGLDDERLHELGWA